MITTIEIDTVRRVIRFYVDGREGYYEWHDGEDGHELKYANVSPVGHVIQSLKRSLENEIGVHEGRYAR